MKANEFRVALMVEHAEQVEGGLDTLRRAVALQVLSGVVLKTPVDTGRARANWTASVGGTVGSTTETVDPSGGSTISAGSAVIASASADLAASIYIQNNLPYIERLEGGYSQQAPGGMAALTAAEVAAQFR